MIAMPLGFSASGAQSMCVTLSKLWVGGIRTNNGSEQEGAFYCHVLIIVAFSAHMLGFRVFKQG